MVFRSVEGKKKLEDNAQKYEAILAKEIKVCDPQIISNSYLYQQRTILLPSTNHWWDFLPDWHTAASWGTLLVPVSQLDTFIPQYYSSSRTKTNQEHLQKSGSFPSAFTWWLCGQSYSGTTLWRTFVGIECKVDEPSTYPTLIHTIISFCLSLEIGPYWRMWLYIMLKHIMVNIVGDL